MLHTMRLESIIRFFIGVVKEFWRGRDYFHIGFARQ
jgi:hypothetical protein